MRVVTRWTHVDPALEANHQADPHYSVTGKPAWWHCYACWQDKAGPIAAELLLDGRKPPVTFQSGGALATIAGTKEPDMAAQP